MHHPDGRSRFLNSGVTRHILRSNGRRIVNKAAGPDIAAPPAYHLHAGKATKMGTNILPFAIAIPLVRDNTHDPRTHDVFSLEQGGLLDTEHLRSQNAGASTHFGRDDCRPPVGQSFCPGR